MTTAKPTNVICATVYTLDSLKNCKFKEQRSSPLMRHTVGQYFRKTYFTVTDKDPDVLAGATVITYI